MARDTNASDRHFMAHPDYDNIISDLRKAVIFGEKVEDPYAAHRAFERAVTRLGLCTELTGEVAS